MRVELHPEAETELRAAAFWYDEQRSGLGIELMTEVSAVLERIAERPASFPAWPGTRGAPLIIRKAIVQRFPYVVAFETHTDHHLVLAITHAKRRPLHWLARAF